MYFVIFFSEQPALTGCGLYRQSAIVVNGRSRGSSDKCRQYQSAADLQTKSSNLSSNFAQSLLTSTSIIGDY